MQTGEMKSRIETGLAHKRRGAHQSNHGELHEGRDEQTAPAPEANEANVKKLTVMHGGNQASVGGGAPGLACDCGDC